MSEKFDNIDILPTPDVWDKVAEDYGLEIKDSEIELAREIRALLDSLGVDKNASLLELGSGSGHLSGLLYKYGYRVTLLDFSSKAIEKSKKFFEYHGFSGSFIQEDIFNFSSGSDYDVIWNSGVMEHFNDKDLTRCFKHILKRTKKYFLFIVPNPRSLPYIMFRYMHMRQGTWTYGVEYLREDYNLLLENVGFKTVGNKYLGWGLTKDLIDIVFRTEKMTSYFGELTKNNLISETNAYLKAFVSVPGNKSINVGNGMVKEISLTEYKTVNFDIIANYNRIKNENENEKKYFNEAINQLKEGKVIIENKLNQVQEEKVIIEDNLNRLQEDQIKINDELSQLNIEKLRLLEEINHQKLITEDCKNIINKKDAELIDTNNRIVELSEELAKSNKALGEISDWAQLMKSRLDMIDSSVLIRLTEKFYRLMLKFQRVVKAYGFFGTFYRLTKKTIYKIRKNENKEGTTILNEFKASIKKHSGKVIVTFPIITWSQRWQRPQHILSNFAKSGYTVLYIAMGVQPKFKTYRDEAEAERDIVLTKLQNNVYKIWLTSDDKFNIYTDKLEGRNLNNMYYGMLSVLKNISPKKLIYLVQFPGWSSLAYKLKDTLLGKIVFDCMDDHSGFSTNSAYSLESERELLKRSDLVITTSNLLYERSVTENSNTILVRNGTEFDHFSKVSPNGELDHLKKPIIGYYGAISDWFDMEIVEYCAKQKPEWSFVMIGSTNGCDISRAQKYPNIHFLGEKNYNDLPGYLYYFDVCLIPFKIIPLTMATNPVKFYEYLSCGKPVVSVRLPELEQYREVCYLANEKNEFFNMINLALEEKDNQYLVDQRIKLARENSWEGRYNQINKRIKEMK